MLNKTRTTLEKILPSYAWLPLLVTVTWNSAVYYGARLITQGWPHHLIELPLDRAIPFVPWTVSIYYASFVFWVVNYILCARQGRERAYRFLSADLLAKTICLICFVAFPTTNIRPVVGDTGFWNAIMRMLYEIDAADNLFPSIHCLTSWFCYIGLRDVEKIPRWYRNCSFWMAVAVFISTLTTKQHVIVDVIGGVALASGCYWLAGRTKMPQRYGRVFEKIGGIFIK